VIFLRFQILEKRTVSTETKSSAVARVGRPYHQEDQRTISGRKKKLIFQSDCSHTGLHAL